MTSIPRGHDIPAPASLSPVARVLDRFFHFHERGSSLRTELLAGLTTFSTYSYILVVNPLIMSGAGMDFKSMITATAVVAAVFTLFMGLRTNYPLGMAPAMGSNAYIAVQLCQGMHVPWQGAIGLVFYAGVLFFLISVSGFRQKIIESFPASFKKILSAGIGFFIAFIGLKNAGIVLSDPHTPLSIGNFSLPSVWLGFLGIALLIFLVLRRVPGALILSIAILTLVGLFLPGKTPGTTVTPWPTRIFDWPHSISAVFLQLDFGYFWHHLAFSIPVVLTLTFGDLFSAMTVLIAVGTRANLNDAQGNLPKLRQALSADATAGMVAPLIGTNLPVIFLESTAGVEQGGRTGLVSVVISFCFLLALFIGPVIASVPGVATAPALVAVGIFMTQGLAQLELADLTVAATALVTILLMTFASIGDGLGLGFILWSLLQLLTGKGRSVTLVGWLLCLLFLAHFLFHP
jgi:AGZA family xanthine/uracil permease-like MFS transporter